MKRRWRIFCAQNKLFYRQNGNTVEWTSFVKAGVIPQVDRFNNLYAAGFWSSAAILPGFTAPTTSWEYTPKMVDRFLNWVKDGLEKELNQNP